MPLVSLCPKERSAELVKEGLSTIQSYCEHQEKTIKELREENQELREKLERKTIIYSILDETYRDMSKSQKEWIDVNWKSIINGFADNLEEMVPDEESDEDE
jgi:vacuolar-type H+-ATPase subunit H